MSKPIQEAYQLVAKCQQDLQVLLSGPEHNRNLLSVNANFRIILAHLTHMGATLEPDSKIGGEKKRFAPITNFMGKEIKNSNGPNSSEEIIPKDSEKEKFLAKVAKLYAEIGGINPENIIKSYTQPDDINVLRGVAIRAGIADKNDKTEISKDFVEAIQFAIAEKAETEAGLKSINDASKVAKEVMITAEEIAKSPYLKKLKASPGDKFLLHPDGKYEQIKTATADK